MPPGSFQNFFCSSEPGDCCATFEQPWLPMVQPPQFLICDLRFGTPGGLREISRPHSGPKTPKSRFSRSWGPFWARRAPTKFVCMLNADPLNPVWGPLCPQGPRHGRSRGHYVLSACCVPCSPSLRPLSSLKGLLFCRLPAGAVC